MELESEPLDLYPGLLVSLPVKLLKLLISETHQ